MAFCATKPSHGWVKKAVVTVVVAVAVAVAVAEQLFCRASRQRLADFK